MSIHLFKHAAHRVALLASGALAMTMLVSSCSDTPTDGSTTAHNPLALITGGAAEVSFNNLDGYDVDGFAKVSRSELNDDGVDFNDHTFTSLWGIFSLNGAPAHVNYLRAAGNDVAEDAGSHVRSDMRNYANIVDGADVRFETQWADGVTFDGSVRLPAVPRVTNINPYDAVSAGRDLTITTGTSVAGGEAVVTLFYDELRSKNKGLSLPAVDILATPAPVVTYLDTQNDDGTLTIPAAELSKLVTGKVYMLTVQRFRYVPRESSLATRKVGLVALSEQSIPIVLNP